MPKNIKEIENLRKLVKHKMIDKGLDGIGNKRVIANTISTHPSALSMALTGHRNSESSYKILLKINEFLDTIKIKKSKSDNV